ncbi:NRDE family protein [Virgibacillus sp. C22-A2]|uniref:NRDE family protein n=1 Tax=Virgibacillus tibetensis TaxID=3042313 RepID=A0ABU6KEU5_9BACI|nr:NRDE family protein [Virgibacillus sp. C22-A2]
MCLINFHLNNHPNYKLIVAANRDEFYDRPTAPAQFWEDEPEILAGRDLLQKGTWLGITKRGRFAALTNFRDPDQMVTGKASRGEIVKNYLAGNTDPLNFLQSLKNSKDNYTGFNVIVGNTEQLFHYNNIENEITEIPSGTHGLSNHSLNTPWPKVTKGKKRLSEYITDQEVIQTNVLFEIISDAEEAQDWNLPETGVSLDLERKLSPLFIKTPNYGTRSSTVLIVGHDDTVTFVERTYEAGELKKENEFSFHL